MSKKKKDKKKTTTLSPSKLKEGKRTLLVSHEAYTKFVVLRNHTTIEWSGYGPILHDGNGNYELKDFYYLSTEDSGAETNLPVEATAQAWMQVVEDGYELDGLTLAWVHCHPNGGAFWSPTDEAAVRDLTTRNGKGIDQISVLFHGGVIARIDTLGGAGESMNVSVDYGKYAADIDRAQQVEDAMFLSWEEGRKKWTGTRKGQPILPGYEHLYPELTAGYLGDGVWKGYPPFDVEQCDEESTTWIFTCELCLEHVSQSKKPLICMMCGGKVCEGCEDSKYKMLCVADASGLEFIEAHAREAGPCDICYLCESVTEKKGELYCEQCRPIFQNVKD